ncbi:tyrosine-type recombinase/integrase [Chloroflexota bacterium]
MSEPGKTNTWLEDINNFDLWQKPSEGSSHKSQFVEQFAKEVVDAVFGPQKPTLVINRTDEICEKFLGYKRASNVSQAYLDGLRKRLKVFTRYYPDLPTEPEQIESYLSRFNRETSTAQDNWKVLKMLYGFAEARYDLPNPVTKVAKPRFKTKPPRRLTESETRALLAAIETDLERAIIYVFLGLGLRLSEAQRILIGDIKDDTIMVHGKERDEEIPLLPEIKEALLKLCDNRPVDTPVFRGWHGPLSTSEFDHIVRRVFARAGITGKRTSAHTLRHTKGVMWVVYGGDTASSKRLLRHTTTQMTDHYSQLNLNELQEKEARFNPLRTLNSTETDAKCRNTSYSLA